MSHILNNMPIGALIMCLVSAHLSHRKSSGSERDKDMHYAPYNRITWSLSIRNGFSGYGLPR